ncbi:hypothetical protein M2341_002052 [Sphingobium sp. B7D2B]|uniref:hypothetical protein n=1 Tax=Sphingobium sp. B7D2B TaxID=2940583 RepID=UPI002225AE47|nr:hypothetical protein [Sphingobium sp. B7D2B]MCW2366605.1 hypothetical protein [Sphingobium sp. B7D2B]
MMLPSVGARLVRDPVMRCSYDVDDRRAKPGRKIGNGSAEHGGAFKSALLAAAKRELIRQHREGYRDYGKLQWTDIAVLERALDFLRYDSGDFYVDYSTMARRIGKDRKAAIRAIERLEYWGFISRVRRSEKRDDVIDGQPGPRRKQAPNAYYFDLRRRLSKAAWQDFWCTLKRNLARIGQAARNQAHIFLGVFNQKAADSPRRVVQGQSETEASIAGIKCPITRNLLLNLGRLNGHLGKGSASP